MQKLRTAMLAMTCAAVLVSALSAQSPRAPQESTKVRHLVYIGTPGDNGTDNQSGVIVLDADKDYSFIKRIPYDLPAAQMPAPKVSGITASLPLQMLYVTTDGWMTALDLATDKFVWTFKGETAPVVVSCTLLPYDQSFEMGATLAEAARPVSLNHSHCARFCVLGGGSCSVKG